MFHIDIYLESSSWYLGVRERWGGYVMAYQRENGELFTAEGFEKINGTYNHVLLHMLAEALKRVQKPSEIHICSANSYILDMMDNYLPIWAKNGWKTSRGQPIKEKEEWETIWNRSQGHILITERGLHEFSHWMMDEFARKEREGKVVDNSVEKAEKPHKQKCDGDFRGNMEKNMPKSPQSA